MLTRAQKQEQIDALKGLLAPANGLFVMDFTGLSVGEVTELRRKVREAKGSYRVVRNTLAKLALADFAKTHEKLQFRGGLVEGHLLDAQQAKQVAALPSRKELVAKLLFLLQSPLRRLVTVLASPVRGLAVSLHQIAEEKQRRETA